MLKVSNTNVHHEEEGLLSVSQKRTPTPLCCVYASLLLTIYALVTKFTDGRGRRRRPITSEKEKQPPTLPI